jgi:hypothetical protein
MAAPQSSQLWGFDVSLLMILIVEGEELNYRLSQRSLLECLAAVPVAGVHNYIRSYDLLHEPGSLSYFSPYSSKSAPLRNIQLANAIKHKKLLEDSRFTIFRIPKAPQPSAGKYHTLLVSWILTTWALFAGILAFAVLAPDTTWIGLANCIVLKGWSILLRLIEYINIKPASINVHNVTHPDGPDAVFLTGRSNSAFVLEGSRKDVQEWTSPGLVYATRPLLGIPSWLWQGFTRLGSLAVLAFIFSSIPNGSTMDQLAFIILNGLAQLNVVLGQQLNSRCRLSQLEKVADTREGTRMHVYAKLLRRFRDVEEVTKWVEVSGILPKTEVWDEWKRRILLSQDDVDPKKLYRIISSDISKEGRGGITRFGSGSSG